MTTKKPTFTRSELSPIAQRQINAYNGFIENCTDRGLTVAEAEKVFHAYKKAKAIKYNGDTWNVVHGALWDADVMRNALAV